MMMRFIAALLVFLSAIALLPTVAVFSVPSVEAQGAWDIWRYRYGRVLARGVVRDEQGYPQYVQYKADGTVVAGWSYQLGAGRDGYVLPASEINSTLAIYQSYQQQYKNQARVMSVLEFNSAEFKTVTGQVLPKIPVDDRFKSVLVKPANKLLNPSESPLLMMVRFNLASVSQISNSARSVLLDPTGNVIFTSEYNIAYKSAFYESQNLSDPRTANMPGSFGRNLNKEKAYAPMALTSIEIPGYLSNGGGITDKDGKYTGLFTIVPCPCFSFDYTIPVTAKYYYSQFTATGARPFFDYQMHTTYTHCSGYDACPLETTLVGAMTKIAIMGIYASMSDFTTADNFFVDSGFIAGTGVLANPSGAVRVGTQTSYAYQAPDLSSQVQQKYDFDGDSKFEQTMLGNLVDGKFVCKSGGNAEFQGVYFSTASRDIKTNCGDDKPEESQPDVVRLADKKHDASAQGLVSQISQTDLKDTDIFVFRESTGMLITHRQGLSGNELAKNSSYYGVDGESFRFQMMMRGPAGVVGRHGFQGGEGAFSKFQSNAYMNPALHQRQSDHLKPGEAIKVVLINRKTGYIGTQSTVYDNNYAYGIIQFARDNIVMQPPNLKISVERRHKIKDGMTKGKTLKNIVGYEGSALGSDEQLILTTEWYDHSGAALPDGLADFGYTGRVAQVTGPNRLSSGGSIGHFAIKPGKHIEHIQLPDDGKLAEHFYVQVSGQPIHKTSDFSATGAATAGPLLWRPKHYVPFLVPVLDETLTLEQAWLYKKQQKEGTNNGLDKPEPVYHWVYRPELQFSTYQLKADKILRETNDKTTIDIFKKSVPMISNVDNLVRFMHNLIASNQAALEFLGAGQQLVFALGEAELKAKMGANQQLEFTNLEHLSALDVEDFVTLRLYNNNDPSNVLWQFAFETLLADVRLIGGQKVSDDGSIFVTADDTEIPLQAIIPGYQNRQNKSPVNVTWSVEGSGQITKVDASFREQGAFPASIVMPKIAGSKGVAVAQLGTDNDNKIKLPVITVVPGKPKTISLQASTAITFIAGHKPITLTATVKDAHGNAVADGTPINFSIEGEAKITANATATTGGTASITIAGDQAPDATAKVKVKVQELTSEYAFEVKPLVAVISSYPPNMEPKTESPILVTVTEDGTNAVPNVDVVFGSNGGKFKEQVIKTNGSGVAEAILHSGYYPIERLEISARVGMVPATLAQLQVKPKVPNYADSRETLLIGDATSSGETEYTREDGLRVRLPYTANGYIQLKGEVGHQMPLQLGSMFEPNLQPIAAYAMKEVEDDQVEELNQLHSGTARHVQASLDNPNGTGQSYLFNAQAMQNAQGVFESSTIEVPASERFRRSESTGFRVNVKLNAVGGSIFNLEGGAQQLLVDGDGRLVYQLWTSTGQHSVQSAPLTVGQWYTVAGRYFNGTLELAVEGLSHDQTAAAGTLKYGISQRGLSIGEDFSGHLVSLKFYDWTGAPLMTFADGSTSITHQMQAAHDRVEVISTGSMNLRGEQAGMLRIGLLADGQQTFVGVISKAHFTELSKFQLETNSELKYPPLTTAYQQQMTPWPLMGVANAGLGDWIAENALDVLKAAVGFLIPYEDGISLVKQLYYFGFDKGQFDVTELVLSALGVVTGIPLPFTKIFAPLVGTLKTVLRSLKLVNPRFFTAMGGLMTKIIDELKNKRYDTIYSMAPMLLVMGEMVADGEARQGFMMLIKSIGSVDDLLVWARYLGLPADGWEDDGNPPQVSYQSTLDVTPDMSNPLGFINTAYASRPTTARRIAGAVIGRTILKLSRKGHIQDFEKNLVAAVGNVADGIRSTPFKSLRKAVFSSELIDAALVLLSKATAGGFKAITQGIDKQRIRPEIILASIVFIESEIRAGRLFANSSSSVRDVRELYMRLFVPRNDAFGDAQSHGASFHLAMLAYYHALHQYGGGEMVKAIESQQSVQFQVGAPYARTVDIELDKDTWVELKSKVSPMPKSHFNRWSINSSAGDSGNVGSTRGGRHIHKEFFTDLVKANQKEKPITAVWKFHSFRGMTVSRNNGAKTPATKGPDRNEIRNIRSYLCETPGNLDNKWTVRQTGKTNRGLKLTCESTYARVTDLHDTKGILEDFIKYGLFGNEDFKKAVDAVKSEF